MRIVTRDPFSIEDLPLARAQSLDLTRHLEWGRYRTEGRRNERDIEILKASQWRDRLDEVDREKLVGEEKLVQISLDAMRIN